MMHIEQEKLNYKLKEVLEQNKILNTIDETITHKVIALGSLVTVNEMMLFISTALPKIILNDKTIFAVSPQSPLGSKLMGKEVGFEFELQGKNYKIAFVE
jgi:transcription elongation GreA/GreB family factor